MKILNLYAGLGGNRMLWGNNHEVTAVEIDKDIAAFYKSKYPKDVVIVGDAHEYLLKHYSEFDFIWGSPPCPDNSRAKFLRRQSMHYYPDLTLYEELLFLKTRFDGKYLYENVIPYYKPLIKPTVILDRHLFWSNFYIGVLRTFRTKNLSPMDFDRPSFLQELYQTNLDGLRFAKRKLQLLRNMVDPDIGKYLLECAMKYQKNTSTPTLFNLLDT